MIQAYLKVEKADQAPDSKISRRNRHAEKLKILLEFPEDVIFDPSEELDFGDANVQNGFLEDLFEVKKEINGIPYNIDITYYYLHEVLLVF